MNQDEITKRRINLSKKLIPFKLLPASWGLKGKSREIAQAEYELEGLELELKLLEINKPEMSEQDYQRRVILTKFTYGAISDYEYSVELEKLTKSGDDLEEALATIDLEHGLISERQRDEKLVEIRKDEQFALSTKLKWNEIDLDDYEKQLASLKDQPWVKIVISEVDENDPVTIPYKANWNSQFIEYLHGHDYMGASEEETVEIWFANWCRNIALHELVSSFSDEDMEHALELKRKRIGDGKTEIS